MFKIKNNPLGNILVAPEVVENISGLATIECYGLVGMVAQNFQTGLISVLGIESLRKGVQVKYGESGLIIDVYVMVAYGTKIHEVAKGVMDKVTYVLEEKAGLKVSQVNVNIMGVK